jgi:hypothetical protein
MNLEVLNALDNRCAADDSVAARNGFLIHVGGLYPHSVDIGYRNGIDPHHSGTKSRLASALGKKV